MEISKVGQEYNTYRVTLSYGELMAIQNALKGKHDDSVSDEMYNSLEWYTSRLPEPGSEDTKLKEINDQDDEGDENDGADNEDNGVSPDEEDGGSGPDYDRHSYQDIEFGDNPGPEQGSPEIDRILPRP